MKITTPNIKSYFKYNAIANEGTEHGSNFRYYTSLVLLVILFLCMGLSVFLIVDLFFPTNYIGDYNISTPLGKGQYRASLYSLLSSSVKEDSWNKVETRLVTFGDIPDIDKVLSCYYNAPTNFSNPLQLLPEAIHPHLCTHINVAFASVVNNKIYLNDNLKRAVRDVVKLKKINSNLKILLSVGGNGDIDGFSEMVLNHANRKEFIRSIKSFLREYKADGIDLDWEFPGFSQYFNSDGHPKERQHFSQLIREIRVEYQREKRNYLLTVAAAAQTVIVENSYDLDQLDMYTDYVNIMTYDFHSYSRYTPFTGLNSPLYPRKTDFGFLTTLNINATVSMYAVRGLSLNKMVIGVPTYGHSYTLLNANNPQIASPAVGFGSLGSQGFVNYPDVCRFMQYYKTEVTIQTDTEAKVPYLYRGHEWVSYENQESVMEKAKFVNQNKLRGAMIYSLNADDHLGNCQLQNNKFPLSNSIRSTLNGRESDYVAITKL